MGNPGRQLRCSSQARHNNRVTRTHRHAQSIFAKSEAEMIVARRYLIGIIARCRGVSSRSATVSFPSAPTATASASTDGGGT